MVTAPPQTSLTGARPVQPLQWEHSRPGGSGLPLRWGISGASVVDGGEGPVKRVFSLGDIWRLQELCCEYWLQVPPVVSKVR